ncbi:MAG: seg [Candidatus Adlerbacteria bacterium]|nr:seg [Candidatus Adlerbacteria bacterium]
MPGKRTNFHNFALKSILFKGRDDWYFCYVKAERIAHVLAVLERSAQQADEGMRMEEMVTRAAALPGDIAHLAAGEIDAPVVLADIFSLLSAVRLASTEQAMHAETAAILEAEYETVAERLMAGSHPSPFISVEDFHIPQLSLDPGLNALSDIRMSHSVFERPTVKDTYKGHIKEPAQGHTDRAERILELIRKEKSVSIKDISATIKGCSEKTIQRELNILIEEGLVRRVGERRWSQYVPA